MKLTFLGLLALPLAFAQAANVTNGSFETNTTDGGSTYQPLYQGFAGLPGWRFSASPVPVLIGTPDDSYAYKTPFGRWQLDLSGSDNTTGGWIETEVNGLIPGRDYRLKFAIGVSTAFLSGGGPPQLKVLIGETTASFSAPPTKIIEWFERETAFRAATATVTVRFQNTSPSGTGLISVDNLSIAEVSLPPQVALVAQPDGRLRLEFQGALESSGDLSAWTPEPSLVSGTLLSPAGEARFFRAVGN